MSLSTGLGRTRLGAWILSELASCSHASARASRSHLRLWTVTARWREINASSPGNGIRKTSTRTSSTRAGVRICAPSWPRSSAPKPGSRTAPTGCRSRAASRFRTAPGGVADRRADDRRGKPLPRTVTVARDMLDASPVPINLGVEAVAAAIDACMVSAQACTSCANSSLAEDDVAAMRRCIALCDDCADVCTTTLPGAVAPV